MELSLGRQAEELLVRHGAPEEVGEAGRQLVFADRLRPIVRPGGACRRARSRIELHPEEEVRRDQDSLHGELDPALEAVAVPQRQFHEAHQPGGLPG